MTIGVVVMAYGTPASADDIEAYYTHIRRGRPPAPEQLDELRTRYDTIGGVSPLRRITEAQCRRLADALGPDYHVQLGYKHSPPFIEEAVRALAEPIVGVVLAPHFSRGSVGEYLERLAHPAVETWHDLPAWRAFQARAVRDALAGRSGSAHVLFSAHSLPERVLQEDDRYTAELTASATAIASEAGLDAGTWSLAWQSAGRTPEPWRGPDISVAIAELDVDTIVVCPQGFTADSLEILYDLDVVAREQAAARGISLVRTPMVNDDETVLVALAERVRSLAAR